MNSDPRYDTNGIPHGLPPEMADEPLCDRCHMLKSYHERPYQVWLELTIFGDIGTRLLVHDDAADSKRNIVHPTGAIRCPFVPGTLRARQGQDGHS